MEPLVPAAPDPLHPTDHRPENIPLGGRGYGLSEPKVGRAREALWNYALTLAGIGFLVVAGTLLLSALLAPLGIGAARLLEAAQAVGWALVGIGVLVGASAFRR
jgi:hypothetical protein